MHQFKSREDSPITIKAIDEPNNETGGGARHEYRLETDTGGGYMKEWAVQFQQGPIKEHGVNGIQHADLLAILIDRLEHFQAGPFACRENALVLTKLQEALHWSNHRTDDRIRRNVEGKSEQ